jgi:excisionase family DNA binding protein
MNDTKLFEQLDRIEKILNLSKKVLTFEEALLYTGISPSYMYKLTSSSEIPHYKPTGKRIFFYREELEKWLLRNRIKTNEEIEREASSYVILNKHKIS